MMPPEQIAAMRADAEAGTPGPWVVHPDFPDYVIPAAHSHKRVGAATDKAADLRDYAQVIARPWADRHGRGDLKANARNIARVPDMIATILAQAAEIDAAKAEIAKLQEMLAVQWKSKRAEAGGKQPKLCPFCGGVGLPDNGERGRVVECENCGGLAPVDQWDKRAIFAGIPWRDGPPPKDLIGKQVLTVVRGRAYFADEWGYDPQSLFHQDSITHHAAITKPGEAPCEPLT